MRERQACGFARWSCWIFRDPQTGWFFLDWLILGSSSKRILLGPSDLLISDCSWVFDLRLADYVILDPDHIKSGSIQDLVNSVCGKVNMDNLFKHKRMHIWSISTDGGQSKSQWQQLILNECLEKKYDGPLEPHNQESHADCTSWRSGFCRGTGRGSFSRIKEISKTVLWPKYSN